MSLMIEPLREIDTAQVEPLANEISRRCHALAVIDSQESADAAAGIIKDAAHAEGVIKAYIDPICETANKAHKAATGLRGKLLAFKDDVQSLRRRVGDYFDEQKRIAERARMEAERKAREEADRLRREQEDAAIAKAAELEAQGKHFSAQVALKAAEAPIAPVAVERVPEPQRVEGLSFREDWKWKEVDRALIPDAYKTLNETLINQIVRNQKDKTNIPGIEVYKQSTPINQR